MAERLSSVTHLFAASPTLSSIDPRPTYFDVQRRIGTDIREPTPRCFDARIGDLGESAEMNDRGCGDEE